MGPFTTQEHREVARAWLVTLLSKQPLPSGTLGARSPREQTDAYASPRDSCMHSVGQGMAALGSSRRHMEQSHCRQVYLDC